MNRAQANSYQPPNRRDRSGGEDFERMQGRSKRARQLSRLAHIEQLERRVHELQAEVARLEDVAFRDALTGLYNRRYFDERVQQELSRADRNGEPLTLIMIDIDRFKDINDRCGHTVGDKALRWVAEVLQTSQRQMDVVARVGGDEFTMILPATDKAGAEKRVERIRAALAKREAPTPLSDLSLSIGIATTSRAHKPEDLLETADLAMYEEKRSKSER